MPDTPPPNRTLLIIAALAVVGLVLRVALPTHMAVEHFDEGVYASNLVAGAEYDYQYPNRHLFAPPLLPWLIEWSQVALGVTDFASIIVNLVAGSLTVLLAGLVGCAWFGDRAGIAAAALAALSGVHILYSRTALTDPLLCLWMLAAVYAYWAALGQGDFRWAAVAGLLTGLAWWTKYNGWLPLAIALSAAVPWLIFTGGRRRIAPTLIALAIAAGTAVLVWSPVWYNLPDGYAAVAANHRQYLVGFAAWPENALRQLANQRLLDGIIGPLSLTVSMIAAGGFSLTGADHPPQPVSRQLHLLLLGTFGILFWGLAAAGATNLLLWVLGGYWLWRNIRFRPDPADETPLDATAPRQLAVWMLTAWIVGLTLTTPLYTAYPRLTLPWVVALWLAGGAAVAWLGAGIVRGPRTGDTAPHPNRNMVGFALGMMAVGLAMVAFSYQRRPWSPLAPWQSRTGLADIAAAAKADIVQSARQSGATEYVVDVYGEPALFFQLRRVGIELAFPVGTLRFAQPDAPAPTRPTFLLAGPHAQRSDVFGDQFRTAAPRLKLLKTYTYTPSDFVLLNHFPPDEIRQPGGEPRTYQVQLYKVR